jgi:hypothetical protein
MFRKGHSHFFNRIIKSKVVINFIRRKRELVWIWNNSKGWPWVLTYLNAANINEFTRRRPKSL